ncbi:MAG TPA: GFA family protein [Noviherbaspirillum sp.]|uniref:GFA family protein n=1 Tax=Noviherbaspirillum sp. TaxID=1926288 RepID=UPI002D2B845E|nr:GFA family protein [Noviherbaspirillum sp.]HYD94661.1 GFA family protein [Noviherbaspirillum sp.]
MSEIHEGGCLCRSVRYRAIGPALRTLVCHCRFCQKMTGSTSYAETMYPVDAVEFIGRLSIYRHYSETSAKPVHVHFCPTCGTTVTLTFERWPEYRAISRGTFDDPDWIPIDAHIWTESAQSGVVLPASTDCFRQARIKLDGTPEVAERFGAPVFAKRDA